MGAVEWVIVGIVCVWVAIALFFVIRSKKRGKNCSCSVSGCNGNCADCSGCHGCPKKRPTRKLRSDKNPVSADIDGKNT